MSENLQFYATVTQTKTYRFVVEAPSTKAAKREAKEFVTFDLDADSYDETIEVSEVKRYVE